jgi:hypothetical protein
MHFISHPRIVVSDSDFIRFTVNPLPLLLLPKQFLQLLDFITSMSMCRRGGNSAIAGIAASGISSSMNQGLHVLHLESVLAH